MCDSQTFSFAGKYLRQKRIDFQLPYDILWQWKHNQVRARTSPRAEGLIRDLRKQQDSYMRTVATSCILMNILVAAAVQGKKAFASVLNGNRFHYSISCKVATPRVPAKRAALVCPQTFILVPRSHRAAWSRPGGFGCSASRLRNFRPYFSWPGPSRVEFICHSQAEIFLPRKREKASSGRVLFQGL